MEKPQLISGDGQHFSKVHIFKERDLLGEDRRDVKKNAHKSPACNCRKCTPYNHLGARYVEEVRSSDAAVISKESRERFGLQSHLLGGGYYAFKHKAHHK